MNKHLVIRKAHRYLGLCIGIQFLFWTISGLYFSWNDLDDVHGDHFRKHARSVSVDAVIHSPQRSIEELRKTRQVDSLKSITMVSLAGKPLYQIAYFSGLHDGIHPHVSYALADAVTGALRDPLNEEEAVRLATDHIAAPAQFREVKYLTQTDNHHEYRGQPLPAWEITFSQPDCTVFISAERGTFQAVRHDQWRIFDFLWMFHTMDYQSRDDFNNWLLKLFSIFGVVTVFSGFALFVISSRTLKLKR